MQTDPPITGISVSAGRSSRRAAIAATAPSSTTATLRILGDGIRRWAGPSAIALVLFEGMVRTFIYSPRPQVYDRHLGEVPAPGSTWVNGREGLGHIHWNQQGIRGRDLPAAGAGKVHRIVVMGDSFTEAEGVNDNQTYCARLEDRLSQRLRQDVWVGNCGRPALDAADYLYYLPAFEKRFHPELIVITYNLSDFRVSKHLICGVTAQFDPAAAFGHGLIVQPLSQSKEDALLDKNAPRPVARLAHGLIDHSGLALYGAARLYAMHWRKWAKDKFITQVDQIATVEQMERYFASMIAISKTPIACAYVAPRNPISESNNHWDQITERRLMIATARLKIPYVDSSGAFRQYFARTGQPANGFSNTVEGPGIGHLNAEGHRVVAETMAPAIERLLAERWGLHRLRVAQWQAHARWPGIETPVCTRTKPTVVGSAPQARVPTARG